MRDGGCWTILSLRAEDLRLRRRLLTGRLTGGRSSALHVLQNLTPPDGGSERSEALHQRGVTSAADC